jgi:uncharacterized protein DUF5522
VASVDEEIARAHAAAVAANEPGYLDPATGLFVFTAVALAAKATCCDSGCRHCPFRATASAVEAIDNAHAWFEVNSGWAPPDPDILAEWAADGVCRCPDDCIVAPDAWCTHGLASWCLIMDALDER